jgi:hypothetical protein
MTQKEFYDELWQAAHEYNIQNLVDKYTFEIYEYSQIKSIDKLREFFIDLRIMGKLRMNEFTFTVGGDYGVPQEVYRTSLGNRIFLYSDKIGKYMNDYKIKIE